MERNITEETVYDHKEGKEVTGNKTQMKTTLVFAAPHVSLDVNFENLRLCHVPSVQVSDLV
jgi:hypothetical protein